MIYVVAANPQAAFGWCIDEGVDVSDRTSVRVVTCMGHAHGQRPRPGDQIVLAAGFLNTEQRRARLYLLHQQELGCTRRENSLRQAP